MFGPKFVTLSEPRLSHVGLPNHEVINAVLTEVILKRRETNKGMIRSS
jgi:hypothetical protein